MIDWGKGVSCTKSGGCQSPRYEGEAVDQGKGIAAKVGVVVVEDKAQGCGKCRNKGQCRGCELGAKCSGQCAAALAVCDVCLRCISFPFQSNLSPPCLLPPFIPEPLPPLPQHKATQLTVQCRSCKATLNLACKPGLGGANIPSMCSAVSHVG